MNRRELDHVKKVLEHIKIPDEQVRKALAFVDKDIAIYEARRGSLRDQYEVDISHF